MTPIRTIGIIMDGNRRWAKAQKLLPWLGHRAGIEPLKKIAEAFPGLKERYGLEYAIFYTFSTENWKRDPEELSEMMKLFEVGFKELLSILEKEKDPSRSIRVRIIGDLERFSPDIREILRDAEKRTEGNSGGTAVFALSYGGRAEILAAVNTLIKEGRPVDETSFSEKLMTAGIPDPDLIIRTGGEKRLSNFLPWQGVYSELFFTGTLWPDFDPQELEKVFEEFLARKRNFGA